jgi:glycosyltransferase involved in cell wall biosynthesis
MSKVLFISHDDTRTGAPILLLNLKKAVTIVNGDIEVNFLIKNCFNQLITSFQDKGYTIRLTDGSKRALLNRIIQRFLPFLKVNEFERKIKKIKLDAYDFILSNTITNGDILPIIRKNYTGVIVSYIHELEMASSFFTHAQDIKQLISNTDYFAYPSIAVKDFLIEKHKISEEKLFYLPYYIPHTSSRLSERVSFTERFTFRIGGCGTTDWRKGIDLFLQVALIIKKELKSTKIKFIWKGAVEGLDYERLLYDIRKAKLEDVITIEKSGSNMDEFWNSLDLFLLTSREDPFPLVVLEAASYKVPTIAFNGAGGATEFISEDAGIVIPYLDVQGMADAILHFYDNIDELSNAGNKAFNKASNEYLNVHYVNNYFNALINKIGK